MKLRVAGIEITKWENLELTIVFDSIKSVFSVDLYWNPWDKNMRIIMLPGGYSQITIVSDNGNVLLTGVIINPSFKSSAKPSLVSISGYSLTGILDDVEFSALFDTTQISGKTFLQIVTTVCNKLGISVIDNTGGRSKTQISTTISSPRQQSDSLIERSEPDRGETVAAYISDLAKGLDIILSHDQYGNLVLNYNLGLTTPVYNFTQGMPGVVYELSIDGSQMHSTITAASQADELGGVPNPAVAVNPYVAPQGGFNYRTSAINNGVKAKTVSSQQLQVVNEYNTGYRPRSVTQTDTDPPNLQDVANQALADELTAVSLTIDVDSWELAGRLVPTASIVTVQNPELYLFNIAKFFVRQITYKGNADSATATYHCTLPESYNGVVPTKSIFYDSNFTNFVIPEDERVLIPNTEPFFEKPDL